MKAVLSRVAPWVLLYACQSTVGLTPTGGSTGTTPTQTPPPAACQECTGDSDCGTGGLCAQFDGDIYCTTDCTTAACASGSSCAYIADSDGRFVRACVPSGAGCNVGGDDGSDGSSSGVGSATTSGAGGGTSGGTSGAGACPGYDAPETASCCTSCTVGSGNCQNNGCYGGYDCKSDTCKCVAAPTTCGTGGTSGTGSTSGGGTAQTAGGGSGVSPTGGTLGSLSFAIVGDTRPPVVNDTAGYPSAIISKIYQDVQAANPAFVLTTGDYVFAEAKSTNAAPQFDLYLAARALYSGTVFYTMGNHECTGYTTSNCGTGNTDGITNNYTAYLQKLVSTIGQTVPYYRVRVDAVDSSWSAKFLIVAANAWDTTQANWLTTAMQETTTYTFIVRHEGTSASNKGVSGSAAIMAKYPYTALLAGHTHTFEYFSGTKEVITGNGGAPLTGSINYGYVMAIQNPDGTITFTVYDYDTNAVIRSFSMHADGSPA